MSFGLGPHYCVGADLGRVQLKIAIEEILATWDEFHISGEPIKTTWPTNGFRSPPVTVTRSAERDLTDSTIAAGRQT